MTTRRKKAAAVQAAIDRHVERQAEQRTSAKPAKASIVIPPRTAGTRGNADCSIASIPDFKRDASKRIAADIAAFEARGGVIEHLGITKHFHNSAANDSQDE